MSQKDKKTTSIAQFSKRIAIKSAEKFRFTMFFENLIYIFLFSKINVELYLTTDEIFKIFSPSD